MAEFNTDNRPNLVANLLEGLEYVQWLEAEVARLTAKVQDDPIGSLEEQYEDLMDLSEIERNSAGLRLYRDAKNASENPNLTETQRFDAKALCEKIAENVFGIVQ